MTIILAILVFGLIIFVHELGHFVAAKLSGITVYQFSIGFGPALLQKKVGETTYAIRLLPIGGAVMMKGESDEEEDGDTEGSFMRASLGRRFCVCFAGSFMNYVSGLLVLIILMLPTKYIVSPVLTGFMDGFEAGAGDALRPGDKLVNVNGFHVFIYGDIITALELGIGKPYQITVERDGSKVELEQVQLEKKLYAEKPETPKYGLRFARKTIGVVDRVVYAFNNSMSFLQSAYKSIGMLIAGDVGKDDVMGTVGIANEISAAAKRSAVDMWYFVAFLSINLAFVNLLPIPGLDGGKILFLLIELVRRKPMNPKYEGAVQLAGLVLIFGIFIFVTYNDIMRLITG